MIRKKQKNYYEGITLIALVIMIIVLLILAGATLSLILGEEGILKTAQKSGVLSKIKEVEEQARLLYMEKETEGQETGEKVTIEAIVNDLKVQGYNINSIANNVVSEIKLNTQQITMGKNEKENVIYTIEYEEETAYFVKIEEKYYEIKLENKQIVVSTEETKIEEVQKPLISSVTLNKEEIITTELEENGIIEIHSKGVYGEVEVTITCGGKTALCKVNVVAPPAKVGLPEVVRTTTQEIPYNWEEIAQFADLISKNADIITCDTEEIAVTIKDKTNTLKIGDTATVKGRKVRILGFNHDLLSDAKKTAYGEEREYAGISFEYVDELSSSSDTNGLGNFSWRNSTIRSKLNGMSNELTDISQYIKEVKKEYVSYYNSSNSIQISNDKLWLLSCAEIGKGEYTIEPEGKQYKYYDDSSVTGSTKTRDWWLRSPDKSSIARLCYAFAWTKCSVGSTSTNNRNSLMPGFSI